MSSWRQTTPFGGPVVPPGVEDVAVVGRARADVGTLGRLDRHHAVEVGADLDDGVERARPPAHQVEARRQVGLGEHDPQPGVGDQVGQLLGDVAVVDVHRDGPQLVAGQHDLDELVAVVEVEADVVVAADARAGRAGGRPGWPGRRARRR